MFKEVITWMDWATIVVSFFAMFFAGKNWLNDRKKLEKVEVYFNLISNNKEFAVDTNLTRKDCQRSEVQGILRTKLIKGKSFYEIDYLSNKKYVEQIFDIQNSKSNKLTIYLQDDELEQFGLTK